MQWSSQSELFGNGFLVRTRLIFSRLGAKVVVNDVQNAQAVADEIKQQGGEATACDITVERGDDVVQAVVEAYGRIDLVSTTSWY